MLIFCYEIKTPDNYCHFTFLKIPFDSFSGKSTKVYDLYSGAMFIRSDLCSYSYSGFIDNKITVTAFCFV